LLIVDAFAELADEVDAALAAVGDDPRTRFLALGDAMCDWAVAHPARWTLLYGTPVADYSAPAETTNADGTRVMQAVLRIAADAADAGTDELRPVELAPEVTALLERHLAEFEIATAPDVEFAALTAWSSL